MHHLEKSVGCPMIQMFMCQLSVMEITFVTTEAGVFGLIFGPGHL